MNNDYAQVSMTQQRNPLEQAIFDDEKRSINALSLFISKFLIHLHFHFHFFFNLTRNIPEIFRTYMRSDCSVENFVRASVQFAIPGIAKG